MLDSPLRVFESPSSKSLRRFPLPVDDYAAAVKDLQN